MRDDGELGEFPLPYRKCDDKENPNDQSAEHVGTGPGVEETAGLKGN